MTSSAVCGPVLLGALLSRRCCPPRIQSTLSGSKLRTEVPAAASDRKRSRVPSCPATREPTSLTVPPETPNRPPPASSPEPRTASCPRCSRMARFPSNGSSSVPASSCPPFSRMILAALSSMAFPSLATSSVPRMVSSSSSAVLSSRTMCFPPGMRALSPSPGATDHVQGLDHSMGSDESGQTVTTNLPLSSPWEVLSVTATRCSPGCRNVTNVTASWAREAVGALTGCAMGVHIRRTSSFWSVSP
mmetsp:Transcript_30869/g.87337  ORF Transcript_30869/g.87337 Transcript_30869/m.87337 type:complete len:246 (+) Transcript_30869:2364-3101(+)